MIIYKEKKAMSGNHLNVFTDTMLNTIEEAIEDIRLGKVIIVVDDEDRENEGDFICAAECVSPEIINFMATHGRGLICAPIDEKRADHLGLHRMVNDNTALHETAFTVSVDLIGHGCSTGISAHDRATGIRALVDPEIKPGDFARPGHIFPLRAKSGGVLRRTGHTEAAIDLARLAGFSPAGVLVEILNEDGTMARLPQLKVIADRFNLKIISIKDLVAFRMRNERIAKRVDQFPLQTAFGKWTAYIYHQLTTDDYHLAITNGEIDETQPLLVRVHSSPGVGEFIGDVIQGKKSCLEEAMQLIHEAGSGIVLFMQHKEKEHDLIDHVKQLFGTPENSTSQIKINSSELRDFGVGAQILRDLGAGKIKLLSRSSRKPVGLTGYGLEVVDVIQMNG